MTRRLRLFTTAAIVTVLLGAAAFADAAGASAPAASGPPGAATPSVSTTSGAPSVCVGNLLNLGYCLTL